MNTLFNITTVLLAASLSGCYQMQRNVASGGGGSSALSTLNVLEKSTKNLEIVRKASEKAGSKLYYQLTISELGSSRLPETKTALLADGGFEIKLLRKRSYNLKLELGPTVDGQFTGYVANGEGQSVKPIKASESVPVTLTVTSEGLAAGVTISNVAIDVTGSYSTECVQQHTGYYKKSKVTISDVLIFSDVRLYQDPNCKIDPVSVELGEATYNEVTSQEGRRFNLSTINKSTLEFLNDADASSFRLCGKDNWSTNEVVNLLELDGCDKAMGDIDSAGFAVNSNESVAVDTLILTAGPYRYSKEVIE